MSLETLSAALTKERYVSHNLDCLDIPALSRGEIDEARPEGIVKRTSDSTLVLQYGRHTLGMHMPFIDLRKTLSSGEDTAYVVLGYGMGHLPRALRARTEAPVIVYEPNPGLLKTALSFGPQDVGNVPIVTNLYDLNAVWARLARHKKAASVIATPGYPLAFPEALTALSDATTQLVQRTTITKNTLKKRAKTWVKDILENVELLEGTPPFLSLEQQYKGVPAFIVGAGPSLDKNVQQLKRAYRKGIVFAANTAAIALGHHGVKPHAIVCIETIDQSERLRTIPFLNECIRAFSLSACPNTLRTGDGPLLPIYEAVPQYSQSLEELTGVEGVAVCGSVSTAAVSLARKLGCSPVVLVGQDMAFSDGKAYAGGTGYETSTAKAVAGGKVVSIDWNDAAKAVYGTQHGERHKTEPLIELERWGGGGTVMSGPSFIAINTWLRDAAKLLATSDDNVELINCTEGGAHVEGISDVPLKELLDRLPDTNITPEQIVKRARAAHQGRSRSEIGQWATSQAELMRQTKDDATQLRKAAKQAAVAMRSEKPARVNRAFRALDAAESALKRSVAKASLIDAWSSDEVDDVISSKQQSITEDLRSSAQQSISVSTDLAATLESAAQELEQTLLDLAGRLVQSAGTTKGNSLCRC